jgi:hypothetical protein
LKFVVMEFEFWCFMVRCAGVRENPWKGEGKIQERVVFLDIWSLRCHSTNTLSDNG